MRTQYFTASSLDGFIADSNNAIDWLLQFGDPGEGYAEFIQHIGAIVMGSTTYEWLHNEIFKDPAQPQPWPYQQPTWVFSSRTLKGIENADIRFVNGSVRPVHAEMAKIAGDNNIWIVGGGDLAGQFFDQRLLNDVIVTVVPVTLGSGAPLLPRRISNPHMKLVSAKTYGEHYVELRYEIALA